MAQVAEVVVGDPVEGTVRDDLVLPLVQHEVYLRGTRCQFDILEFSVNATYVPGWEM